MLYFESFTRGVAFSGRIAMLAVFLHQRFGFQPLDVGVVFMFNSVTMILNSLFLVKWFQTKLGKRRCIFV